ncbi:1-acyl-sn-glycerol-3-phosphate acyltransferase [Natronoflexus pectinivorans]|uniref:1-acyl-sn-glycerol-3-phosphate acyltransferase n=2 Tax=Natronoflexus pectinivorans TaxID=682526 RepID=A0A4R2GNG1_9BACT|nr:1-acyl-sn-glycerol-3-phosphate acyltransferase [Natronoflexus pectinivorans]
MRLVAGYIFTPVYYLAFGLLLVIFHPVQVIARKLGGYHAHLKSVNVLNGLIMMMMRIIGARVRYHGLEKLPDNRPLIVASNHQSMFDISAFINGFKKFHPKFVSKIELASGIPSISYNLKHSGSALIDRKNGSQSIKEIIRLGRMIEKNNYAVCIFPEGTRSRTGKLRKFQSAGVKSLLKAAPSSLLIPFAIDGHTELMDKGYFPLKFGVEINYTVLDPIEPGNLDAEMLVEKCREAIEECLRKS